MVINLSFGIKLLWALLIAGVTASLAGIGCVFLAPAAVPYLFLITLLLFIAVLAFIVKRNLIPRVKRLAATMEHVAEGDLTARVRDGSNDEFGMLAGTFDRMLDRLAFIVDGVHTATSELRGIGSNVGTVVETGVGIAESQTLSAREASQAARSIYESANVVTRIVSLLTDSAETNSSCIFMITSNIKEIEKHVDSLVQAIERVTSSISNMSSAQNDINFSINSLMNTADRTAGLVSEIDQSVQFIKRHALETASISDNVLRDARLGMESVQTTISGISEIRSASRTVHEIIDNLSAKAANIGKILQVIDEVAERTSLLSLNASIIAAQAGEQGKGFAVVAEEIKTLARRTKFSTREIAEIVTGVQVETGRAVNAIRLSEKRVVEGEVLSLRSGEALDKIVSGLVNATAQINNIADTTVKHVRQSSSMRTEIEGVAGMVKQIVKASDNQTHNSRLISYAADGMRDLASQVHILARTNNDAVETVVTSSDAVITMVSEIRKAGTVETTNSEAIVSISRKQEEAAMANLESTKVMQEAVSHLTRQIRALDRAMKGLNTGR